MSPIETFFAEMVPHIGGVTSNPKITLEFVNGAATITVDLLGKNDLGLLVRDPEAANKKRFYPWSAIFFVTPG